jgi:predicted SprT family Zn-dependent metalloprotease
MDFCTKTVEEISMVLAEEIGKLIADEEIRDLQGFENGIREMLKEVGVQTYEKVLEKEERKLGKWVRCECGAQAQRISKRGAKVMTVFGWVSYRRSYYGCYRCGVKQNRLDKNWDIHPREVSPVLGKLLAIAGVDSAFERARRKVKEFLISLMPSRLSIGIMPVNISPPSPLLFSLKMLSGRNG